VVIDSHQHFWKYNPVRDRWITDDMKTIQRDFVPDHLAPILVENRIAGCITVQADQSEDETEFLLALSDQNSFVKGVVGWVDLSAENIGERLEYFSSFKKLKGFRHVVQAEAQGFMKQSRFMSGISQLEKHNFTYDILIYSHQLDEAIEFVKHFPNQKFVVDHLAKPNVKQNRFGPWSKGINQLASFANVFCKISGFTTEADWNTWKAHDFYPYFDFILEHFGPMRLLYGSDWPVCLVAASYEQQLLVVEDYISKLSAREKELIMGGNAMRFYNL
jgi:L-fuconolactonase